MKKEKILVLGNGYVGSAFAAKGYTVLSRKEFEYNEKKDFRKLMRRYNPKCIINCIGRTNTRWCEESENFMEALYVNGNLPYELSGFCNYVGVKFVHMSTGCLYDRTDVSCIEDFFIAAHCNYTVTKWVGEKGCSEQDLIIRPRLLFDSRNVENNLLVRLQRFDKFSDVLDSLTSVHVLISATKALIDGEASGIFNVACDGNMSMRDIGEIVLGHKVKTIEVNELRRRAALYLVNNRMNLDKLRPYYSPPNLKDEIRQACFHMPRL